MVTSSTIRQLATSAGFDLCGIATAEVIPKARAAYRKWLAAGYHGEMGYLAKDVEKRTDPGRVLPGARSVIMLGLNYYQPNADLVPHGYGRIARYARGKDYHKVAARKLKVLVQAIEAAADEAKTANWRWLVDYGPLTERPYAEKAGLGFLGKNGMLINRKFGSWVLLAEIITTLELEPDQAGPSIHGRCGSCRLCIESCPTGAIISPRRIDSARCLSYLTIERPSHVPDNLARHLGDLVFGCDICQEVCPYNRHPVVTPHAELLSDSGVGEFVALSAAAGFRSREEFLELTAGTSLTRPGWEGFKRNARLVLRNQTDRTRGSVL